MSNQTNWVVGCDYPEAPGIGTVEMAPQLMGGLHAVPEPTRPDLDDRTLLTWPESTDYLGVGAVVGVNEPAVAGDASVWVVNPGTAEAAGTVEVELQQESETVIADQQ